MSDAPSATFETEPDFELSLELPGANLVPGLTPELKLTMDIAPVLRDAWVDHLNALIKKDPETMTALFESRVPMGKLAECDDEIVVTTDGKLGLLGILNGFLGPKNKIVAFYSDTSGVVAVKPEE